MIPSTSVYGPGKLPKGVLFWTRILAGAALAVSVLAIATLSRDSLYLRVLLGCWFIIIYKRFGANVSVDEFRYGQETMTRLWAGLAAAFAAYVLD